MWKLAYYDTAWRAWEDGVYRALTLQKALDEIKTLKGIVPICAHCKKIRDDKGYWNLLESYIEKHSEAEFSHGMCPDCIEEFYGEEDWYIKMKSDKGIA